MRPPRPRAGQDPDRWRPWDPSLLGKGSELGSWGGGGEAQHVPPAVRAQVDAWAREYQDLAQEVDRRYQAGQVQGLEALEERLAWLEHRLEHALEDMGTLEEEHGLMHELHVGLEEELARAYADFVGQGETGYDRFEPGHYEQQEGLTTREQVFARHVRQLAWNRIEAAGGEVGPEWHMPPDLPEEALIEAARQAWLRRQELRRRYQAKPPGPPPAELARRARGMRRPPPQANPTLFEVWLGEAPPGWQPTSWRDNPQRVVLKGYVGQGPLVWGQDFARGFNERELGRPTRTPSGARPWALVLPAGQGRPGAALVSAPPGHQ